MNKQLTFTLIAIFFTFKTFLPTVYSQTPTANIATWKDNKKAAYTIIHDDYSNYVPGIFQYADPIATARGIKLCFGAITNFCGPTEWTNARTMIAHGHECVNHSHNHKCGGAGSQCSGLTTYGPADFATELGISTQLIQSNTGVKPRFFIHPYDAGTNDVLNYLTSLGYLGTRLGTQEAINTSSFSDFMRLNFHVYTPTTAISTLNQVVDQAVASGGYAVREFHGIDDGSWGAMTVANYTNHLNYVKAQMDNGNVWSATATEAITYKMQRDAYQPIVSYNAASGAINVSFTTLRNIDPSVLTTPITLNINLNSITKNYNVTQNGATISSTRNGSTISVNVYPNRGNLALNCTDCGTTPPPSSDVTKLSATPQTNAVLVTWSNPTTSFNNVLVVAKETNGFTTKPTATNYIANANFTGSSSTFEGGKVVYQGSGSSVQVTNLTAGRTYFFCVYVRVGTTWSSGVQISAVPTGTTTTNPNCLQASYYNNTSLSGTPVAVRYESSINYDWGTNRPNVAGVNADNFSVRWKSSFTVSRTGYYQFTTRADDGVRLWVNNSLLINRWNDQSATSYTAYIYLIGGVKYPIQMDYYERGGNASAKLSWSLYGQTSQIMTFSNSCVTTNLLSSSNINLDGRLNNGKANLQWVVETQNEVDYYQLEKMNEQGAFSTIGTVNDNRTNMSTQIYNFVDEQPTEGENVYRIQTVFKQNAPPQYSNALTINYLKNRGYAVFPNPAHEQVQVDLTSEVGNSVRLSISTLQGKLVMSQNLVKVTDKFATLDLSLLETGSYMISIAANGKKTVTQKLIVSH